MHLQINTLYRILTRLLMNKKRSVKRSVKINHYSENVKGRQGVPNFSLAAYLCAQFTLHCNTMRYEVRLVSAWLILT